MRPRALSLYGVIFIGLWAIVTGALLLANSLGHTAIDVGLISGVILGTGVVAAGLAIVRRYWAREPVPVPPPRATARGGAMRRESFLGDIRIGRREWQLEDMEVDSWIGDVRLDLTRAHVDGEKTVRVMNRIGDVKIWVPESLPIAAEVSTVIGKISLPNEKADGFFRALSFTSPDYEGSQRRVVIKVKSIIGDVAVRYSE